MTSSSELAQTLDLVHHDLTRYVKFPSAHAADAVTLWVAATHAQPLWEHATRLVVKSPVKRCGKTRLQEVVRELVHNPLVASNPSAAALVHSITEDDPPCIILDEADTYFGKKGGGDEKAEAIRNILNAGHSRGWPYLRWDVKRKALEACPTFAMALIGGIGDFPDTIEDRAVVITMQRRAPGELVAEFRRREIPALHQLRGILGHAMKLAFGGESFDPPELPVEDRAADCWESLVAVADAAGDEWGDRARKACLALTSIEDEEQTLSQRLLADLKAVWGDQEEHLPTNGILPRLHALEESPWADYFGRPLNPRDLARLLRPFQVSSRTIRLLDGTTPKGYARADLYPVWKRYTHMPESPPHTPQAPHDATTATPTPTLTRDVADVADVALSPARVADDGDVALPDPFEGLL